MTRRSCRGSASLPLRLAHALLAACDPPDAGRWSAFLAEGVHLRVGNRPIATTRAAAAEELALFFGSVRTLGAEFRTLWPSADDQTVLVELDYVVRTGGPALPLAMILRAVGPQPLVRDLRFYLDPAPLALGAAAGAPPHGEPA